MAQRPDQNSPAILRGTALLTGILVFVTLVILDAWNIAPHSPLRAAIARGVSSLVAMLLVRPFYAHKGP